MKYLISLLLINVFTLTGLTQEVASDVSAKISKIEVQGTGNGNAHIKVWISSNSVESLDYVKMQFSGAIIPRMTVLTTLKQTSSVVTSSGTNMIIMEGDITVNETTKDRKDTIRYLFKKSGPVNFRNLRAGSVIYFPPLEK